MAGHPTIGSTFALARAGVIEPGRERWVFGLGVGPTPVSLTWRDSELAFVWMTQLLPQFIGGNVDPSIVAAALGLQAAAVAGTGVPPQVVSCGVPFLFVPLTTRRAVDHAAIDHAALEELYATLGTQVGIFLFSKERGPDKATVYSRMFAPNLGVAEDPATGSASGPLGCYLVRHKLVSAEQASAMLSAQGVKMGRPSSVHISIGVDASGNVASVRVGGEAILVGEALLYV